MKKIFISIFAVLAISLSPVFASVGIEFSGLGGSMHLDNADNVSKGLGAVSFRISREEFDKFYSSVGAEIRLGGFSSFGVDIRFGGFVFNEDLNTTFTFYGILGFLGYNASFNPIQSVVKDNDGNPVLLERFSFDSSATILGLGFNVGSKKNYFLAEYNFICGSDNANVTIKSNVGTVDLPSTEYKPNFSLIKIGYGHRF